MSLKKLWVEAYRPTTFSDGYIFNNIEHKRAFERFVKEKQIPNLLLSGVQGSGKTTAAKILINMLEIDEADILVINGSDNNSIDYIRDTISSFANTFAMSSFKIVFIDEADYVTPNAQAALRVLMEESSENCRFILACNYDNKIIPALKSRVQQFTFKTPSIEDVAVRIGEILITEEIVFDTNVLLKYVSACYPDIRKIINMIEQNSHGGQLIDASATGDAADYKFKMFDYLKAGSISELRSYVCKNVPREEFEDVYRYMYDNLHEVPKFQDVQKYSAAIVTIAAYLYKHALVADPEINIAAMFIELNNI